MVRRIGLSVLIAASLLAGACGGSGSGSQGAATTTSTSVAAGSVAPESTSVTSKAAADEALVRSVLLRASDVPGWTGSGDPTPPSAEDEADSAAMGTCMGLPTTKPDVDLQSPSFEKGDSQVQGDVYTYDDQSIVDRYEAALPTKGVACLTQMLTDTLRRELGSTVTVSAPTIRRIGPAIDGRGSKLTFSMVVTEPATGRKMSFGGAFTSVSVGRLVVEAQVFTTGGTVPMADLDRAMAAQFGRAPH